MRESGDGEGVWQQKEKKKRKKKKRLNPTASPFTTTEKKKKIVAELDLFSCQCAYFSFFSALLPHSPSPPFPPFVIPFSERPSTYPIDTRTAHTLHITVASPLSSSLLPPSLTHRLK